MNSIKRIGPLLGIIIALACGSRESAPDIGLSEVKEGIKKRLSYREQAFENYTCDLVTKMTMNSERGERNSEMSFKLYMKNTGESKREFVQGHRAGMKISKENYEQLEMRRRGPERRGADQQDEEYQIFGVNKYLDKMKLIGAENVNQLKTYKLDAEPDDEKSKFKKITLWVDQINFDIVKVFTESRTRNEKDLGELTEVYSPLGPDGLTMKTASENRTVRKFRTPRGEMTMDLTVEKQYTNYQFNVELDEDVFNEAEK